MKRNLFLLFFFFPFMLYAQKSYKIQGLIVDSINQTPVDYANIGIEGKNLGTVSNDSGFFELEIPNRFLNDSLTFSRIGYTPKKLAIGKLIQKENHGINMISKTTNIQEAQIVSNKLKRKTKGNVSRSKGVLFALYSDSIMLGGEAAAFMRLPKISTLIKDFTFHIVSNYADSAKLRFNLYDGRKGVVGKNLLEENIYFTLHKDEVGDYTIDLSKYNIYAFDDIFVALENVAVYVNENAKLQSKKQAPSIYLSGTLFGSRGCYREVSMGAWKELPMAISPGFWITILN